MQRIDSKKEAVHLEPVPLSQRRSPVTMGLLWLTMVTSFPAVLAGFEWYSQGISFNQLILCSILSMGLLLAYSIPACELGAQTGLGYCGLGKIVFGRLGSLFLTFNLLWLFVAWYALTSVLMAKAVSNLFHWQFSMVWLSIIFALLMSFNNFFGFTGVANFARFMSGPVLTIWVLYVFVKVLTNPNSAPLVNLPHPSGMHALSVISAFVIGFAVWGNEQDYWRYSKPGILRSAIPLTVSIIIGQIIFPLAGWLIARNSGLTDYSSNISYMTNYCFGSISLIGLLIITADYFSTNDSSLFGSAAAIESICTIKHSLSVGIFAMVAAIVAGLFALTNMSDTLSTMVSLNCIILPITTIIMICEWWLRKKLFRSITGFSFQQDNLPQYSYPAMMALIMGLFVGILTSGIIPAFEAYHFGLSSLQAWLVSIAVYVPLRIYERYRQNIDSFTLSASIKDTEQ